AVKIVHVLRNNDTFGVLPRATTDAVARVDSGLVTRRARAEVGAPGLAAGAYRGGEPLADGVGSGQATEIGAVSRPGAGDEKADGGRVLREHRIRCSEHDEDGDGARERQLGHIDTPSGFHTDDKPQRGRSGGYFTSLPSMPPSFRSRATVV